MSRIYKIYKKNGSCEIVKGLMNFCRKNNTTIYKLRKECKVIDLGGV